MDQLERGVDRPKNEEERNDDDRTTVERYGGETRMIYAKDEVYKDSSNVES